MVLVVEIVVVEVVFVVAVVMSAHLSKLVGQVVPLAYARQMPPVFTHGPVPTLQIAFGHRSVASSVPSSVPLTVVVVTVVPAVRQSVSPALQESVDGSAW